MIKYLAWTTQQRIESLPDQKKKKKKHTGKEENLLGDENIEFSFRNTEIEITSKQEQPVVIGYVHLNFLSAQTHN